MGDKVGNKGGNKNHKYGLNQTQVRILAEIRNNPNITKGTADGTVRFGEDYNRQRSVGVEKI